MSTGRTRGARIAGMLTVLALPLVLPACSIGEAFSPPAVTAPAAWGDALASETGQQPSAEWWQTFASPRLDRLMTMALAGNLDLAAAAARVRQADAAARIAGAPLLPSVEAGALGERMRSPDLPGIQTVKQGNILSPTLTAAYELDLWGKNAAALAASENTAVAAAFDRQTVALTTQAAVATTYFQILGLKDRLLAAHENLTEAEHTLSVVKGRMDLGAATLLDVLQQETEVNTQRAAIPPIEDRLRQAEDALAVLVGRLPQELGEETGTLAGMLIPPVAPGMPATLLERRPDVQRAEADLAAAHADVTVARAQLLPGIQLTAEGGFASGALHELLQPGSTLFTLAGSLMQPIFEGGKLEANVDLKRARYQELADGYRKAALSAFADVDHALVAVSRAAAEEAADELALDTARRANAIAQAQMQMGSANIITVLDTQRAVYQAKDALAQARLDRALATVGLFRALGGGWQVAPNAAVSPRDNK